ncbi:MAG TPA: hypothetical protein VHL30_03860 [Chlamydiales bacterium]|jgi:hypothetical protein|nr:hypothetical protein [Chlamydiales bacterium]
MFIPKVSPSLHSESSSKKPVSNAQLETYAQKADEIRKRYFRKLESASGGTLKLTKIVPRSSHPIEIVQPGSSDEHGKTGKPAVTSSEEGPRSEGEEEIFVMDP